MLIPLFHFGFFDREALSEGRILQRHEAFSVRFRVLFREYFGELPGQDIPEPGFFESYGVLSCFCPTTRQRLALRHVERILDFVERTGCDVVYVTQGGRWLVEADRLREMLKASIEVWEEPWP